jgi:excinuclease ABC subunit B
MARAIGETERRRAKQILYNEVNGITPKTILKKVRDLIDGVYSEKSKEEGKRVALQAQQRVEAGDLSEKDLAREIKRLEKLMIQHARDLEFEKAAQVRDQLAIFKEQVFGAAPGL